MRKILALSFLGWVIVLVFTSFLIIPEAKAQNIADDCEEVVCPAGAICIQNPLRACDLRGLVEAIINFIFWVATALAPLMIVIGAFYFVTSAGNPHQIDTAKKIILYTLIGYAIILLSKGLIVVLEEILGVT
jgi:hypothetical protein